jgi:tetratricopeptide (TPR) repeat protein
MHPDIRIVAYTRNIQSGRFIGSNLVVAFMNRGLAYKYKGQWEQAIADYSEAIRLMPNDAQIFNNRGNAHYFNGQLDRAIEEYGKALHFEPYNAQAHADRGLAYEKMGEAILALRDFKKAYALGFRHPLLLKKLRGSGVIL